MFRLRIALRALGAAFTLALFVLPGFSPVALGQSAVRPAAGRYALILEDLPAQARFHSRAELRGSAARDYRRELQGKQGTLRQELASRRVHVTGSVSTLLNAVFVTAPASRVAELKALPGVKGVVPLRRYKLKLNRATELLDAPAAWSFLGGMERAGNGIKIAILDTGIDQTHPMFQDFSLPMPAGYPICSGSDCDFVNNKVIVARSYVAQLAAGSNPANPAADSRPDDTSPRDRDGHGTAVASCAAGGVAVGTVTINGMAPKAYLGNYKIYGSPEINDFTSDDVIIKALDDAINDGMDIVSFSTGGPALTAPLDTGAVCGNAAGVPCDLSASAFEAAAEAGMIIVSADGNEGYNGINPPTYSTIDSPADAPSVIAAGATTNSHSFIETLSLAGVSSLQGIATTTGDAYVPPGAITAPLIDVTQLGNDGLACSALPAQSLLGALALVETGNCGVSTKAANVSAAGALGVIFYSATSAVPPLTGLSQSYVPAALVTHSEGLAIKTVLQASPGTAATLDPGGIEQSSSPFNQVAYFSSIGPSLGDNLIKPDLVAVGTNVYMAAEDYDPLGILYSSTRFGVANGTSFATPLTSGAAALVKQAHPNFTAAQVKSALVDTATQDVTTDDSGNPVDVQWLGGGKVDAGAAVAATVTSEPATISFGAPASLPVTRQIKLINGGSSSVALALAVTVAKASANAAVSIDTQSLSLEPGASATVNVTLSGTLPVPGSYSGAVMVQGPGVSLRIPYWFLEGDGVPANLIPLTGDQDDGTAGQPLPDGFMSFQLIDHYGLPVSNAPVSWSTGRVSGITFQGADRATDNYGIAYAVPILGASPGTYSVTATGGGLRYIFSGTSRAVPAISSGGVVNGASFDASQAIAPGSFISIFGTGLSDVTGINYTTRLPLAIDYVHVSFDVPSAGLSFPGHLTYVSPGQVNVQVPWELAGQTSVQIKVSIDFSDGNVVTVPVADYSPALFESGGMVAALDSSNQVITASHPATRGQAVQLFANGLGPVTSQPASGDPGPSSPLAQTNTLPVVMIGGQSATVSFSGLAPGFAALYQVDASVPSSLAPGTYPVTISIGGQISKASNLVVQ